MANVRSLGLHEPSALPYLVAESVLPANATEDDFTWRTFSTEASNGIPTEEEILFTDSRVVWSQGGVVKKSFALDVEKEKIVEALFAQFPTARRTSAADECTENGSRPTDTRTVSVQSPGDRKPQPKGKKGRQVTIRTKSDIDGIPGLSPTGNDSQTTLSRALVVVLKTQVHIFYLSGDSHVVPLPFEVDSVWPTPQGLLFQRKATVEDSGHNNNNNPLPSAPPNSFLSSQTFHPDLRESGSFRLSGGSAPRQSFTASQSPHPKWASKRPQHDSSLPRVFSLVDPQSEMGLVVSSPTAQESRSETILDLLDPAEEILYVSPSNEFSPGSSDTNGLIFVVTLNARSGMYTVWTARYRDKSSVLPQSKRRKSSTAMFSKRRSSQFDATAGTSTPGSRGPSGMRESFGLNHPRNSSTLNNAPTNEPGGNKADDLATQLGHEFGDTWKTSRRVSSLLARTDLVTNYDRSTFSDLATGSQNAPSMYGGGRRGDSLGGFSNRGSFGLSQRSSLPGANNSTFGNSVSFLDAPVDRFLEGLGAVGDFEGFERMGLTETVSGLPREVILTKVTSLTSGLSTTRSIPPFSKGKKFEVFTAACFDETVPNDPESRPISICILNKDSKTLTILRLLAQRSSDTSRKHAARQYKNKGGTSAFNYYVRVADSKNISHVVDCCKIADGDSCRMLMLSSNDHEEELFVQAPWGQRIKVELPSNLSIHQPYDISLARAPGRSHETGLKRVVTTSGLRLHRLRHSAHSGKVTLIDEESRRHRIEIQLEPRNSLVKRILKVCRFVLQHSQKAGDGIYVGWCEAMKWLRTKNEDEDGLEWTALVVTLFSMAVSFIEDRPRPKPSQKKRRSAFLRSSSSSSVDMEDWEAMLDREAGSSGITSPWMMNAAWGWISKQAARSSLESTESSGTKDTAPPASQPSTRRNDYIPRCATLAREFLSSPSGAKASGPGGYLPTSSDRDHETRKTTLGTVLVGIHLLREELKLSTVTTEASNSRLGLMIPVLAQFGTWLDWKSWTANEDGYYGAEMASIDRWAFEDSRVTLLDTPGEPFPPPSIFAFVESSLQRSTNSFLSILDVVSSTGVRPGKGYLWEQGVKLTPRTLSLTGFISEVGQQRTFGEKAALLLRWGLTASVIDTLPDGISTSLHETIVRCQVNPPDSCSLPLLELIDRDDLFMSMNSDQSTPPASWAHIMPQHDAVRDIRQIGLAAVDTSQSHPLEVFTPEADRYSATTMIFHEDRRYIDAMRILNQMKAPVAECVPEPDMTESDLLEAQKDLVQLVLLRTLSIPIGRAMANFRARAPLLTEKLPIPSFSLQCIMKPSNVTISADRSTFTEERFSWAFFHNGASAGLAISRHARGIDTSWILYNKPLELTNRHSGFLLALGLNGHLKSLAKWVAFKYLIPKHTMTSIGLLLGLSASYLGTMDTLVTRLLSVHITRMLPPGAAELNLSPLTQTTGIMGIGLLYCNSQHRRMSEVMLSEMENLEEEDLSLFQEPLRDEGYRLAAGFALGLINLAKGSNLRGLRDMRILERLLVLAVGTKKVDYVHILDRATAGATVAIAIIFMKSNDSSVAERIDIPDTVVQFDYVRPDIFLLRTLARHLIMWDSMQPNREWVRKNLPKIYRRKYQLTSVIHLSTDDMPLFNIIAGLCFALSLRFAGSGSHQARDLLISYLDQFIRICRLPVVNYDGKLARNSVKNCQDIMALSAATVMAGTGDLIVFRRLRSLHGRIDSDVPYGSYVAAHMAIGVLFLGGGTYTLGTSDLAIASLLCAFYPVFPTTVLDNKCHLQAFRHLWVLAAEPRCLIPRDLDTRRPVTVPVSIALKSGEKKVVSAPCLLPDLADLSSVTVQSPDHWEFTLNFSDNESLQSKFLSGDQSIYIRRRSTYSTPQSSVFASTLMALSDLQDVPASTSFSMYTRCAVLRNIQGNTSSPVRLPLRPALEWIFELPAFSHLSMNEKSLMMSPAALRPRFITARNSNDNIGLPSWLRTTAVDTRLVLEKTVRNFVTAAVGCGAGDDAVRDRLWQIRLLTAWLHSTEAEAESDSATIRNDKSSVEGSSGLWLQREIIEDARWKIWGIQVGDAAVANSLEVAATDVSAEG